MIRRSPALPDGNQFTPTGFRDSFPGDEFLERIDLGLLLDRPLELGGRHLFKPPDGLLIPLCDCSQILIFQSSDIDTTFWLYSRSLLRSLDRHWEASAFGGTELQHEPVDFLASRILSDSLFIVVNRDLRDARHDETVRQFLSARSSKSHQSCEETG